MFLWKKLNQMLFINWFRFLKSCALVIKVQPSFAPLCCQNWLPCSLFTFQKLRSSPCNHIWSTGKGIPCPTWAFATLDSISDSISLWSMHQTQQITFQLWWYHQTRFHNQVVSTSSSKFQKHTICLSSSFQSPWRNTPFDC